MGLERVGRRLGDRLQTNTKLGLLGRRDETVRSADGRIYVRELLATGRYALAVALNPSLDAQFPVRYNVAVQIGYDRTRQRVILGTSGAAFSVQGLPASVTNAADPQNILVQLEQIQPLRCRPSGQVTKDLYAEVLPGRVIIAGVSYYWEGGDIDLSGDVPSSGNHLYSLVALTTSGTLESAVSTAQSTATALVNADMQEAIDALTAGSLPIKAFILENGDTALDGTTTTGAIDMRQLFSTNAAAAASSGSSLLSWINL